ncbi:MAG: hypothetical protein OHK0039_19860 [Bacteroidia bacterium]
MNLDSEQTDSLIGDYLAGDLPPGDTAAVEQRIGDDAAFARLVGQRRWQLDVMRAADRADRKARLRETYTFDTPARGGTTRPLWIAVAALAAALALLVLWVYLPRDPGPTASQLALAYLEPFPVDHARGTGSDTLPLLDSALRLYEAADYAAALPLLQASRDARPDDLRIAMYLGDCLSLTGDYAAAARVFGPLAARQTPLRDAAQWHLALAHQLAGDTALAGPLLREIRGQNHYRQARADSLLRAW